MATSTSLDPEQLALGPDETILAQTHARWIDRSDGILVVTTARLLFVVVRRVMLRRRLHVMFDRPRTSIVRVFDGASDRIGIGFAGEKLVFLQIPPAEHGAWLVHLAPRIAPFHTRIDEAEAADPRIGSVDAARRTVLSAWEEMMSFRTVIEPERWLDGVAQTPVQWADIVEIVYVVDGKGDGPPWVLVVRLADGRWVYFQHILQITGEIYSTTVVAPALESLWWGALTEDDRDRVSVQMTGDRRDEELVQLDVFLESSDAALRARAERRMLRRRERREI